VCCSCPLNPRRSLDSPFPSPHLTDLHSGNHAHRSRQLKHPGIANVLLRNHEYSRLKILKSFAPPCKPVLLECFIRFLPRLASVRSASAVLNVRQPSEDGMTINIPSALLQGNGGHLLLTLNNLTNSATPGASLIILRG